MLGLFNDYQQQTGKQEKRLSVKQRMQKLLDKKISTVSKIITRSAATTMPQSEKHGKPNVVYEEMKPVKLDFDNEVHSPEGKITKVYLESSETDSSPIVHQFVSHRRSATQVLKLKTVKEYQNLPYTDIELKYDLANVRQSTQSVSPFTEENPIEQSPQLANFFSIASTQDSLENSQPASPFIVSEPLVDQQQLDIPEECPPIIEEINWSQGIENMTYIGEDDALPGFPIMV